MSYGTDKIVKLGGNMQTLMAGLLRGIVISDLRIMQYRVRADEYYRVQRHIEFAARHGVLTPRLSNAVFLLEEDIAPYAKSGWFEGPVRSAPDVLTELIDGLLEMLEGSIMSSPDTIVVPAGKKVFAMQLILTPVIQNLLDKKNSN